MRVVPEVISDLWWNVATCGIGADPCDMDPATTAAPKIRLLCSELLTLDPKGEALDSSLDELEGLQEEATQRSIKEIVKETEDELRRRNSKPKPPRILADLEETNPVAQFGL